MSARFIKKVYNDEHGIRRLGFYAPPTPTTPLVSFDLNVLEDVKLQEGELAVAVMIKQVLDLILDGSLTPEELEYAVEDI